jgi:hypothetical protein
MRHVSCFYSCFIDVAEVFRLNPSLLVSLTRYSQLIRKMLSGHQVKEAEGVEYVARMTETRDVCKF